MDLLGRRSVPSPGDVEKQLAEFWSKASTDDQAVMRACSMNLVVVCGDGERNLSETTDVIARIARTAPGRALVVGPRTRDSAEDLTVFVSTNCHHAPSGAQVCSEQVTIEFSAAGAELVPGTILQLLVEEMPVYIWWRRRRLAEHPWLDPLMLLSDYWVVNSADSSEPGRYLETLDAMCSRTSWDGHVIDAVWTGLEPWIEAVASLFDDPLMRPALERITQVRIAAGGRTPVAYLAGWLASRLEFRSDGSSAWLRTDGVPVVFDLEVRENLAAGQLASVQIEAEHDEAAIQFSVKLAGPRDDCLVLCVRTEGHRLPPRMIKLPFRDESARVCGILQHTGPDPVYRAALTAAARFAGDWL